MSDDKIEEIMARHSRRSKIDQYGCYRLDGFTYVGSLAQYQQDVDTLLAEDARHRAEIERLRVAATSAGAALAAAIELLERGRKDAPSKRMFSQMIADYRVIVARTRKALEGEA